MAVSNRARENAGEVLVTAALLGLSLAANLWTSVYFSRYPLGSGSPQKPAPKLVTKPRSKETSSSTATSESAKPASAPPPSAASSSAGPEDKKTPPPPPPTPAATPAERRDTGGGNGGRNGNGELAEILMALLCGISTFSTAILTLLLWAAHRRAFRQSTDGFLLSTLLAVLAFVLGSMLRRWRGFPDWVFCAYAAAALGYGVEARFRYCNQLIDRLGEA